MTDQPYDRRRNDVKLDELIAKVDAISEGLAAHINDDHGGLPSPSEVRRMIAEHETMIGQVGENRELLRKLVDLLEGEDIYSDLDPGMIIDHRPGLIYEVRALRQQSQNGGIHAKVQLTPWQRTLITGLLGLITATVVLLTAILQNMGS